MKDELLNLENGAFELDDDAPEHLRKLLNFVFKDNDDDDLWLRDQVAGLRHRKAN
jgi:hypothetical protein